MITAREDKSEPIIQEKAKEQCKKYFNTKWKRGGEMFTVSNVYSSMETVL